jgi:NADH-quinone oxidoreductase subunit L
MFHLFTHAFFKALLFLGAGSVIHAMHHEQDMRYYGGLRKSIPITFWAMMAGTLAITGVGIAGQPVGIGFAGFYSKDAIIEATWASNTGYHGYFAFASSGVRRAADQLLFMAPDVPDLLGQAALGTASISSTRCMTRMIMTITAMHAHAHDAHHHDHGHAESDGTGGYHPHESPWVDAGPADRADDRRGVRRVRVPRLFHRPRAWARPSGRAASRSTSI